MGQALWLEIICTIVFLFASIWIASSKGIRPCCCFFDCWISDWSFGVYLNHGHDHEGICWS
ncbi:hypothetical protein ACSBR1_001061 [Camellia fascicularis]